MSQKQPTTQFRNAIIERMQSLNEMTPEQLSEKCGGKPSAQHLHCYLTMRGAIGEVNLDRVCKALGLQCRLDAPEPMSFHIHEPTEADAAAYQSECLNQSGFITVIGRDTGKIFCFHKLPPEQLRVIAQRCNAAAGEIEKRIRPETNPSLEAIGEPIEVDEDAVLTPDDPNQIPF